MAREESSPNRFDPKKIWIMPIVRVTMIGLVSLALAILVFIVGINLFSQITDLPDGPDTVDWGLLEGITSLITLSLVFGGFLFFIIEYVNNEIQQRKDRAESSFSIYTQIYDRFTNPEDVTARRWIIEHIVPFEESGQTWEDWLKATQAALFHRPDNWQGEIEPGRMHLKHVLNTFDFIGFVDKHYWRVDNAVVEWLSSPVAKIWVRIGPYIRYEADERQEPDYYESVRELGEKCVEWRREHDLPASNTIRDAT